ncbi:MAG: type II toxin-antitoxin system HicA family toxin [Thermomicrobiales bacterium]
MPPIGPISRRNLIRNLKHLGWTDPFPGGRHEYMSKGDHDVPIPNPHKGDIGMPLLTRILRDAGISRDEWENL